MYVLAFLILPQGPFNDMDHRLDINWFLKESRGVHLFGFTPVLVVVISPDNDYRLVHSTDLEP